MKLLQRLAARFKRPSSPAEAARSRARRQNAILAKAAAVLPYFQLLLALAGLLQFLAIPLPVKQLLKKSFIDENAFQPGQVNTYFSWSDVSAADRYADDLQAFVQANDTHPRIEYIINALREQGLTASVQDYTPLSNKALTGQNAYARIRAPKTSGSEVMVLCAPWSSRQQGLKNVRGTATLLALAKHLQRLSMWSKDIVLLFADGDLEGTQAWLRAYYGPTDRNVAPLPIGGGSIWSSIIVDYPYHSFSHIGLYYDGVNGRLPNLDVVHGAAHIAKWVGGVPVRLHNQSFAEMPVEANMASYYAHYKQRAGGIVEQVVNSMTTLPIGAEGLFSQYGVESIGFFAIPAEGPHGFYSIGRIIESMARAFNNLTERLHASFFLYLLPEPFQFLSVATYLSAPILLGAALTIAGLRLWRTKATPADLVLCLSIFFSYAAGGASFVLDHLKHNAKLNQSILVGILAIALLADHSRASALLPLSCLVCGMLISVTTILNYGLGTGLAIFSDLPLLLAVYRPAFGSKGGIIARIPVGIVLLALASYTMQHYCKFVDLYEEVPGIAPAVLYLGLIPLWIQLALVA